MRMPSIGPKTHYLRVTCTISEGLDIPMVVMLFICYVMIGSCKYYKFNAIYILILYNIRQIILYKICDINISRLIASNIYSIYTAPHNDIYMYLSDIVRILGF